MQARAEVGSQKADPVFLDLESTRGGGSRQRQRFPLGGGSVVEGAGGARREGERKNGK